MAVHTFTVSSTLENSNLILVAGKVKCVNCIKRFLENKEIHCYYLVFDIQNSKRVCTYPGMWAEYFSSFWLGYGHSEEAFQLQSRINYK